ncbi:MAG: hypothetical protein GQ475_05980 [Methylococcaceae bacterium]|nr:hypothetical protein [Methylococcaceae bacterium]
MGASDLSGIGGVFFIAGLLGMIALAIYIIAIAWDFLLLIIDKGILLRKKYLTSKNIGYAIIAATVFLFLYTAVDYPKTYNPPSKPVPTKKRPPYTQNTKKEPLHPSSRSTPAPITLGGQISFEDMVYLLKEYSKEENKSSPKDLGNGVILEQTHVNSSGSMHYNYRYVDLTLHDISYSELKKSIYPTLLDNVCVFVEKSL